MGKIPVELTHNNMEDLELVCEYTLNELNQIYTDALSKNQVAYVLVDSE